MSRPIRVTAVLTHPVQYMSPWFKYIAERCPAISLTVLYGAVPEPEQQGVGFDRAFSWDLDLREGYVSEVLCSDTRGMRFDSDTLFGVDAPDIAERLRSTSPDVVLVAGWHSALQVRTLRACRRLGVPVLYRGDSNVFSGPRGIVRPLWSMKTRIMLRQFDAYLSVGSATDAYLRAAGVPEPLIFRSPHAVDNARYAGGADPAQGRAARAAMRERIGARDDDFVVLFAGKCQRRKRPLDAVAAVRRLGPHAVLAVAGGGPLGDAVRRQAGRAGVRLAWLGFVNQAEMPAVIAAADCTVVPSAWETWGLIVNESLAAGVPCVTSDRVPAAFDLIENGRTGATAPAGDIEALAARLDEVRRARASGHDFAAACRSRVEACSFRNATRGLLDGCRRVLARRTRSVSFNPGSPRVLAPCGQMVIVSGIERMSFEVLRVLREQGAAVHCVVNRWDSSSIVSLADGIGASWSTGYYWYPLERRTRDPRRLAQMAADVVCTSAGLLRDAFRFRPTHVLLPDFQTALRNAPALWLLRLLGATVVLRLGNAPDGGRFYRALWRRVLDRLVDCYVANSRFIHAELMAHGINASKTRVVHNTAPSRRHAASAALTRDERRIIFVGQIIPPKGLDLLLEAVARLLSRGHDVRLDVVGNIDGWEPAAYAGYRDRIRARVASPDLAGRVRLLGVRDDVPALVAAAGVHCCPSRPEQREGFAVVNLEAKQAGVPSVVFPTGSLPEMVTHGVDGWICRDATIDALVDGLERFVTDPELRRRAGEAAARSSLTYGRARFAAEWSDVFGLPARRPGAGLLAAQSEASW